MVVSPKTRTFSWPKKEQQVSIPSGKDGKTSGSSQANGRDAEQEHAMTNTASASRFGNGDSQFLSAAGPSSGTNLGEQNNASNTDFMSRFSGYLRTLFYTHDGENSASENKTSESPAQEESTLNEENWTTFSTSTQSTGTHDENIFSEIDFDMCLRVQPELTMLVTKSNEMNKSRSINHYSLQPTVVFVDFVSLPPLVLKSWTRNLATFPPPDGTVAKTVQISRLLSPKERAASRTSSVGPSSRENLGSKSQDSTNRESELSDSASQGELSNRPISYSRYWTGTTSFVTFS